MNLRVSWVIQQFCIIRTCMLIEFFSRKIIGRDAVNHIETFEIITDISIFVITIYYIMSRVSSPVEITKPSMQLPKGVRGARVDARTRCMVYPLCKHPLDGFFTVQV